MSDTVPVIFDAFLLHDQEGLPLSLQVDVAKSQGVRLHISAFACDAFRAGWTEDKVKQVMTEAVPNFRWELFRLGLNALWEQAGKLPAPDCWEAMKQKLRAEYAAPQAA